MSKRIVPQENLRVRIKAGGSTGHLERVEWDWWVIVYDTVRFHIYQTNPMQSRFFNTDWCEVLPCGK